MRSADFERVLGTPACARSTHFAIHFLDGRPAAAAGPRGGPGSVKQVFSRDLCTGDQLNCSQPVDDLPVPAPGRGSTRAPLCWLGAVVPKRHAKRAVTRSLLKRQIRAALLRRGAPGPTPLRPGLWIVRLRAPFDRAAFPSAASAALREAASGELDALLGQAARKLATAESLASGGAVK